MKVDLRWWLDNLSFQKRVIHHGNPDVSITTDASLLRWRAVYDRIKIQGIWNKEEQDLHINILELLPIFISIRSFCKNMSNIHIKIFSDNSSYSTAEKLETNEPITLETNRIVYFS
jgi:hypothetical protein